MKEMLMEGMNDTSLVYSIKAKILCLLFELYVIFFLAGIMQVHSANHTAEAKLEVMISWGPFVAAQTTQDNFLLNLMQYQNKAETYISQYCSKRSLKMHKS